MTTGTGFDGDLVTLSVYFPDVTNSDLYQFATANVVPGTMTFPNLLVLPSAHPPPANEGDPSVDFNGADIVLNYPAADEGFVAATDPFNGFVFQIAAGDPAITGVSLKSTNIPPLTASDLSFTASSISLNESGLIFPVNAPASIDISVSFATTPAPPPPPVIWIDDVSGKIGTVNPDTGAVTAIGNSGVILTDIAFSPSKQLFGETYTAL